MMTAECFRCRFYGNIAGACDCCEHKNIHPAPDMTYEQAIDRIKKFGLRHSLKDMPNSIYTVRAFMMAINALQEQAKREIDNG